MKTEAVVAAAGIGRRFNTKIRKPYLGLSGRPILIHTLQRLSKSTAINSIILVVNKSDKDRCEGLVKRYGIRKVKAILCGGKERFDSVRCGLAALDRDTKIVLIHDGVRPFIGADIIKSSIDCAARYGACVVAVPVKNTIKRVKGNAVVEKTIDRTCLWEVQTPQVFKKDLILRAYKNHISAKVTDDAMLVERMGKSVRIVKGSYNNIKITTPEDLVIAEGIIKRA